MQRPGRVLKLSAVLSPTRAELPALLYFNLIIGFWTGHTSISLATETFIVEALSLYYSARRNDAMRHCDDAQTPYPIGVSG